jgi:1,2-diacylglycerol 3-beta-glucosyltransferase
MILLSIGLIVFALPPMLYLLVVALASIRPVQKLPVHKYSPKHRFLILIPAHNECGVIEKTIKKLQRLDYPRGMYSIHVIADHCSDDTAQIARSVGAFVHERNEGPRSGKGAAIAWLIQKKITQEEQSDAVIVFDADTLVDSQFVKRIDMRLSLGALVVQGQHMVSNPEQGWFPALTWVMFIIDNRFQNQGRTNLSWSAKNMGDSLCLRTEILDTFGWGEGLTDDYQLRMRLIMAGIRIEYEPFAKGFGEAPPTWSMAVNQRSRWLRGANLTNRQYYWKLLVKGLKNRNWVMLDGAMQAILPPYSTLVVFLVFLVVIQVFSELFLLVDIPSSIHWALGVLIAILFFYPFLGLLLEKSPLRAYLILLTGPAFIVWRLFLILKSQFDVNRNIWVRTEHGGNRDKS